MLTTVPLSFTVYSNCGVNISCSAASKLSISLDTFEYLAILFKMSVKIVTLCSLFSFGQARPSMLLASV